MRAFVCRRGGRSTMDRPEIPIEPVLRDYGAEFVPHGGWRKMLCPFHGDTNPSASVNTDINRFHCWSGCTERPEDTVGLIMYVEGIGFRAALTEAQRIAGVSDESVRKPRGRSASVFAQSWD